MFQNMLITQLTPFNNNEMSGANEAFRYVWPEILQQRSNIEDVTKTIKKKRKRVRTTFTTEQLRKLESTYAYRKYIDAVTKSELAKSLNLNVNCIKIWFQNRRMKEKRQLSLDQSSCDSTSAEFTITVSIGNKDASVIPSAPTALSKDSGGGYKYFTNESYDSTPVKYVSTPSHVQNQLEQCSSYSNCCNYNVASFNKLPNYNTIEDTQCRDGIMHSHDLSRFYNDKNYSLTSYYPVGINYSNVGDKNKTVFIEKHLEPDYNTCNNLN